MEKVNTLLNISLLTVALGGAVGAVARYITVVTIQNSFGFGFPYATLLVNVVGCFIAGLLYGLSAHWQLPLSIKLGIMVGFLGALTTFSAFSIDTLMLIERAQWLKAGINVFSNVIGSLTFVFLGYWLIKKII
jgi:fluoride exporter